MADNDEKQYHKDRLEQANAEARGEEGDGATDGSHVPGVRAEMTGTVTNPGDKPAPDTSGTDEDETTANTGNPEGSFGGQNVTESPRGINRTTRETGEHRRE